MNFRPQQETQVKVENVLVPFGKHKNKKLVEVLTEDPKYLDWLDGQDIGNAQFAVRLREFCKKYSAEIERAVGFDD
jgi:uncharacterized protein (DUF3820 family)